MSGKGRIGQNFAKVDTGERKGRREGGRPPALCEARRWPGSTKGHSCPGNGLR